MKMNFVKSFCHEYSNRKKSHSFLQFKKLLWIPFTKVISSSSVMGYHLISIKTISLNTIFPSIFEVNTDSTATKTKTQIQFVVFFSCLHDYSWSQTEIFFLRICVCANKHSLFQNICDIEARNNHNWNASRRCGCFVL